MIAGGRTALSRSTASVMGSVAGTETNCTAPVIVLTAKPLA
jgi:hypothetical protein